MPVATMLSIAAAFWGSHGHALQQPITWEWAPRQFAGQQAYAEYGSYHIKLVRKWWDHANNQDRCAVVIHEDGHAAFSFDHKAGTVMDEHAADYPPGTCQRSHKAWVRVAARG